MEIEKLIQRGYLREFTKDRGHEKPQGYGSSPPRYLHHRQKNSPRHNPYRRPRSPYSPRMDKQKMERSENSPVVGHVATIAGGIHGGGDSRNARKKYARREVYGVVNMQVGTEAITLTDADCQRLEMPHDDPLVIAPKIAHYTVERMLVDTRSSADIIYLSAFDKLNLPRSIIEPMRTPITGFTRHSVYPLGIARLWVMMGKGLTSTTFQAQFTVVDIPDSSYN
ncbi:hypothetical protein LIER_38681 [Lithospermum erythrorhizon]|uniref:Uncharacterized protein n=1 Tax=Lithospermum erythrorhizon TaxID=34254 RepID=A0AAV3Q4V7_LITER